MDTLGGMRNLTIAPRKGRGMKIGRDELGRHIQDALRYGIPEIGWDGDPWLTCTYYKLADTYEVWDEKDERPRLVCSKSRSSFGNADQAIVLLCMHLRDHDFRKVDTDDVLRRIDEENERIEREARSALYERISDAADRLDHALKTDLGTDYQGDRPTLISLFGTRPE